MELFYLPALTEGTHEITDHNIINHFFALRLKERDEIFFTDGKGSFAQAFIIEITRKYARIQIPRIEFFSLPEKKITLFVPPLKNPSRFEWLVEKATELNIYSIVPILTSRTVGRLKKIDRLKQIIIAASLQSQRVFFPEITEAVSFKEAIKQSHEYLNLIAYCGDATNKKHITNVELSKHTAIWIGPEGDFTEDEVKEVIEHGFIPISLGQRRLRTETAAISAISFVYLHN